MIIRILGEGQWRLDEQQLANLNDVDDHVQAALEADDQTGLQAALGLLLDQIRSGEHLGDEELVESDLIVPDASATLDEVRAFLDENGSTEGLIPG
ncbi:MULTISPECIES: PspA-associated protein PspAA [unclassified Luteococcus]|uniref:PspA-associated protein PspAA n=1 Tax=unclassified Luteococcus TaxID=2639923 RepID=UPI00313C7BFB